VLIHRRPSPQRCLERDRLGDIKARRRKHKPSKAHGTGKARAARTRRKARKRAHEAVQKARALILYQDAAAAYWRGDATAHPVVY
jgi:hypothetical protein